MTELSSTDGHRPARREDDLVVRPVGDETVVYDLRTDRVTALDAGTAAVWAGCDGARDLDAIGAHAGLDADETRGRLLQLDDAGLLQGGGATRRTLLRAGVIGTLVPLLTIAAAEAAFAASAGRVTLSGLSCTGGNPNKRISVTVSVSNATAGSHLVRLFVDGQANGSTATMTVNAAGNGSVVMQSVSGLSRTTHTVYARVHETTSVASDFNQSTQLSVSCS